MDTGPLILTRSWLSGSPIRQWRRHLKGSYCCCWKLGKLPSLNPWKLSFVCEPALSKQTAGANGGVISSSRCSWYSPPPAHQTELWPLSVSHLHLSLSDSFSGVIKFPLRCFLIFLSWRTMAGASEGEILCLTSDLDLSPWRKQWLTHGLIYEAPFSVSLSSYTS